MLIKYSLKYPHVPRNAREADLCSFTFSDKMLELTPLTNDARPQATNPILARRKLSGPSSIGQTKPPAHLGGLEDVMSYLDIFH